MGTHASIIVKTATGYSRTFNQYDGDTLGDRLRAGYRTQEEAEALVNMGEASFIDTTLGASIFYHRDRGELLKVERRTDLIEDWLNDEYVYIWTGTDWRTAKEGFRDVVTLPRGF